MKDRIKKWKSFLNESSKIEFHLKKYMSLIRQDIINNIKIGENKFQINFEGESKINIYINFTDIISKQKYHGETDIIKALKNNLDFFDVRIMINDSNIDYNQLCSVIQHELKHIYDMLFANSNTSFLKIKNLNKLKEKFKNVDKFYYFIHLVYECLTHELDARNAMIYDRFRWLKNYDKSEIEKEFKNTYMYKSLINLNNFDYNKFIEQFNINDLINITNEFINEYGEYEGIVKNIDDVKKFYEYWENIFKKESKKYIKKAEEVICELIEDNRPYMESKLTTKHLEFPIIDEYEKLFNYHINLYNQKV